MPNEIQCQQCGVQYSYETAPPKFCSECGNPIGSTISGQGSRTSVGEPDGTVAGTIAGAESGSNTQRDLEATQDFNSTTTPTPLLQTAVPKQVGPYRILNLLGRGGMGAVYRAEDVNSGRHVALKILSGGDRQTPDAIERFKREGQIAASISHARSTFVYSAGKEREVLYIVMELMPGGTIKDEVTKNGPMSINRAVDCMLDVIDGLEAAHQAGIIHRDIKPSNCFVEEDGRVKVGDYGLSKSFVGDAGLTRTGSFMGTPQFAATEQIKGGKIDERTDIYAIGCTLFYLLTGAPPFEGDFAKVIAGIAAEQAPEARSKRSEIPRTLSQLVAQTLDKDPAKRPQTLYELRSSLQPFATQGSSFADVGRRIAAFSIDWLYIVSLSGFITVPAVFFVYIMQSQDAGWRNDFSQPASIIWPAVIAQGIVTVLYFAIAEGIWGCGVGKLIMGLRVTNSQGELPGFFRAFLRAIILPGLTLVVVGVMPRVFNWESSIERLVSENAVSGNTAGAMSGVELAIQSMVMSYVTWLFSTLFFVTMRKRNGFRGVHGFLSGSRVQSTILRHRFERLSIPLAMPEAIFEDCSIDRYKLLGKLSQSGESEVLVALDPQLERNVWISRSSEVEVEKSVAQARNRPSRQRWLDGGRTENDLWDAWEAVRGVPLMKFIESGRHDWPQVCSLLAEVAEELADGTKDETIPRPFGVDHVWIDESSQVKFIRPKVSLGHSEYRENNCSPTQALRLLIHQVVGSVVVPLHVLDFVEELDTKKDGGKTLVWAMEKLRGFQSVARKWRWDDRLGAMAISAGLEQMFYQTIAFAGAFLFAAVIHGSLMFNLVSMFVLGVFATFATGFWMKGGLVFNLLKINVCDRNSFKPATKFRCGIRNLVAWLPFTFSYALLTAWVSWTVSKMETASVQATEKSETPFEEMLALVISITWSYPLLLFYLGALVAIISPLRGLQDYLCRTRLLLK